MRQLHRLTARQVATIQHAGWHADGGGLYLRISSGDRRRWVFVYFWNQKRREMGLGPVTGAASVTLAQARDRATQLRAQVRNGLDPIEQVRSAERLAAAPPADPASGRTKTSFGTFADEYVKDMRPSWRSQKHAAQWSMTLTHYCVTIREMPIDEISTNDVLAVLKPLWTTRPETAQRLRGRIENVLDAAKARELRSGENPARWRGHLENLLPARNKLTRGHHAALAFDQTPNFLETLRGRNGVAAKALEFTILTAARTNEVLGARISEFDVDKAEWILPPSRTKAAKVHRIPLSKSALAIVIEQAKALPGEFLFPGRGSRPLSNMAMEQVLKRMNRTDITVHGFRSTFRDWAAETSAFPHEVCEMALAHTIANKAEAAYRRGDLFEKRRLLMNAWDNYCFPQSDATVQKVDAHAA